MLAVKELTVQQGTQAGTQTNTGQRKHVMTEKRQMIEGKTKRRILKSEESRGHND